jgi:hypothetical protein
MAGMRSSLYESIVNDREAPEQEMASPVGAFLEQGKSGIRSACKDDSINGCNKARGGRESVGYHASSPSDAAGMQLREGLQETVRL